MCERAQVCIIPELRVFGGLARSVHLLAVLHPVAVEVRVVCGRQVTLQCDGRAVHFSQQDQVIRRVNGGLWKQGGINQSGGRGGGEGGEGRTDELRHTREEILP